MNTPPEFNLEHARLLREQACTIELNRDGMAAALAGDGAPLALQSYLRLYNFDAPLAAEGDPRYRLSFRDWRGYRVALHHWRRTQARGTVFMVHGLFDHCGLYLPLVRHLLDTGLDVLAFDLPGHGLSDGTPAHIADFAEYGNLLADAIEAFRADSVRPFSAVGQSTGCAAITGLLQDPNCQRQAEALEKVVLLAPLVRAAGWRRVVLAQCLLGRVLKQVPRRFGANSHDGAFLHFLEDRDPLQARHVDTTWVKAMIRWAAEFQRAPTNQADLLVVQGTGDQTVDWRWNLPAIRKQFPRAQVHCVEGAMHHLVNEADPFRSQVYDLLRHYLQS